MSSAFKSRTPPLLNYLPHYQFQVIYTKRSVFSHHIITFNQFLERATGCEWLLAISGRPRLVWPIPWLSKKRGTVKCNGSKWYSIMMMSVNERRFFNGNNNTTRCSVSAFKDLYARENIVSFIEMCWSFVNRKINSAKMSIFPLNVNGFITVFYLVVSHTLYQSCAMR